MAKKIRTIYQSIPVVYEEDKSGGYVVSAPTLPGCHSQGETLDEAEKNITEAIELYLETVAEGKGGHYRSGRILQGMVQVKTVSHA